MSKHELTARIAYEIYVQRGRAPGRSREDWAAAEAIVELCLSFAEALLASQAPDSGSPAGGEPALEESAQEPEPEAIAAQGPSEGAEVTPLPDPRQRALELLCAAAEELGRKELAKTLGYKSTSSVGPYLRGQRPIGAALTERILAKLGPQPRAKAA